MSPGFGYCFRLFVWMLMFFFFFFSFFVFFFSSPPPPPPPPPPLFFPLDIPLPCENCVSTDFFLVLFSLSILLQWPLASFSACTISMSCSVFVFLFFCPFVLMRKLFSVCHDLGAYFCPHIQCCCSTMVGAGEDYPSGTETPDLISGTETPDLLPTVPKHQDLLSTVPRHQISYQRYRNTGSLISGAKTPDLLSTVPKHRISSTVPRHRISH